MRLISRVLAGPDTTAHTGLPANELLAPLPLFALLLLAFNDWVLKGSAAPEWLTGKLSDFSGVYVFPLVLTAAIDLVLAALARFGAPVDFTLRRYKLGLAIGFTFVVFGAMKLSPLIGGWVEEVWSSLVPGDSAIYPDRTDAFALVMLAGTWHHGRTKLARGAYGRLALAKQRHKRGRPVTGMYADAARCGAPPAMVAALDDAVVAWVAGGPADVVDTHLQRLRERGAGSIDMTSGR